MNKIISCTSDLKIRIIKFDNADSSSDESSSGCQSKKRRIEALKIKVNELEEEIKKLKSSEFHASFLSPIKTSNRSEETRAKQAQQFHERQCADEFNLVYERSVSLRRLRPFTVTRIFRERLLQFESVPLTAAPAPLTIADAVKLKTDRKFQLLFQATGGTSSSTKGPVLEKALVGSIILFRWANDCGWEFGKINKFYSKSRERENALVPGRNFELKFPGSGLRDVVLRSELYYDGGCEASPGFWCLAKLF